MTIKIIHSKISQSELKKLANDTYGDMIKGVIDVEQKIIALGGELHADAESKLLDNESSQSNLGGFNIHINKPQNERLEYTSFINIRPRDNNTSIEIQNQTLKNVVKTIVDELVEHNES